MQFTTEKVEAADKWEYLDTKKHNTKFIDKSTKGIIAAITTELGITSGSIIGGSLGAFASTVINDSIETAYFVDKRYVRMAGATMQTKHVITMYKDSSYSKKLETKTIITNDSGGPKVAEQD